jgi:hypothetical protein
MPHCAIVRALTQRGDERELWAAADFNEFIRQASTVACLTARTQECRSAPLDRMETPRGPYRTSPAAGMMHS